MFDLVAEMSKRNTTKERVLFNKTKSCSSIEVKKKPVAEQ